MNYHLTTEKIEKLTKLIPVWTLLSFLTLTIGYTGFFTFCSLNNIPFNQPSLYTLVGIGVFNLIYWFLLFITALKNKGPKSIQVISILVALYWLSFDPKYWASIALFYILFYTDSGLLILRIKKGERKIEENKTGKVDSTKSDELKEKDQIQKETKPSKVSKWSLLKNKIKNDPFIIPDLIVIVVLGILGFIYDSKLSTIYTITIYLLFEVEIFIVNRNIKPYHFVLLIIVVPSFLTYSILNKVDYSLIGISKSNVRIEIDQSKKLDGVLIYQDSENLYIKNNLESDSVNVISKGTVSNILVKSKAKHETN